jgi:TrpR family transcriptional regulator, trp operon repressor
VNRDSNKDSWRHFLDLCLDIETPEDMNNLLKLFLTIEEERAISNRYLIIKNLLDGKKSQREISKDIGVSNSALTRGSNGLKIIDQKFKDYLIEKMT